MPNFSHAPCLLNHTPKNGYLCTCTYSIAMWYQLQGCLAIWQAGFNTQWEQTVDTIPGLNSLGTPKTSYMYITHVPKIDIIMYQTRYIHMTLTSSDELQKVVEGHDCKTLVTKLASIHHAPATHTTNIIVISSKLCRTSDMIFSCYFVTIRNFYTILLYNIITQ